MRVIYSTMLLIIVSFTIINPVHADNLGRLFTSADDRKTLEKIRHEKVEIKKPETVKIEKNSELVATKKEIVTRNTITLKGLVYRSNGKNTAWINDTNTFDGDLESQFIYVPVNKINRDKVTIIMSDDNTSVELKVGQNFIPATIERDVVEIVETKNNLSE